MNRVGVIAGLLAMSFSLSACMSMTEPTAPEPASASTQSGIQGTWVDDNGIVSTFRNGRFKTRTTDTNSVMATGSYGYSSDDIVTIDMHSNVSNQDTSVNCAQVGPAQLNCTASNGKQFVLHRANTSLGRAG